MPFGYEPSQDTRKAFEQARNEHLCSVYSGFFEPTASLKDVAVLPDGFCQKCRYYLSACICGPDTSDDDDWQEG